MVVPPGEGACINNKPPPGYYRGNFPVVVWPGRAMGRYYVVLGGIVELLFDISNRVKCEEKNVGSVVQT